MRRRQFSGTVSSDSSLDPLGSETDEQLELEEALLVEVERFAEHCARLRAALGTAAPSTAEACVESKLKTASTTSSSTRIPTKTGTSTANCPGPGQQLQIHSGLALVSQSVRELLCRHPRLFKTGTVLAPAGQLVRTLKGQQQPLEVETGLQALDRLEAAVANALRTALKDRSRIGQARAHLNGADLPTGQLHGSDDEEEGEEEEDGISVKSAKANSSSGVSSSPNGPVRIVRRHSAFQLPARRMLALHGHGTKFASPPPRSPHPILGAAQSLQLPKGLEQNDKAAGSKVTAGQPTASPENGDQYPMWQLLEQRSDGLELAFERCKTWSKFATQLLAFARSRLCLEQEYGQRLQKLAEQQLAPLSAQQPQNAGGQMPLAPLFGRLMEANQQFAKRADCTVQQLQQRFVANLESRQKEHDTRRRKLKAEYAKQRKQMEACAEELRRARQTHTNKGEQYLRAREVTLRQERECHQMLPSAMQLPNGQLLMSNEQLFQKRRKEVEKRRRAEEEALTRKSDAELEVSRLERELEERRDRLTELRRRTLRELADLIRQCELTTIACTANLLKGIASLWTPVPRELERLADAARASQPGHEFMSFLQSTPTIDSGTDGGGGGAAPNGRCHPMDSSSTSFQPRPSLLPTAAGSATPSLGSVSSAATMPSPSRAVHRRNALAAAEEHMMVAEAQQKRRGKTSVVRLFDNIAAQAQSSSSSTAMPAELVNAAVPSDAARSHRLQRTRQVTKCAQCEHLLLFDALKCQCCGLVWHRKCLPLVQLWCGPTAAASTNRLAACAAEKDQRRTSIFGVPLRGHLEAQKRQVPLIMERCVDELQRRGMGCKGLYRTCGVKSKVEEICVQFEQCPVDSSVDLSEVHPMNIASVVKLYLRRLPEPLLTYELYADWLRLDQQQQQQVDKDDAGIVKALRELVQRMPEPNYQTLRFLALHLNRVTWFELQNLMTASNLAAVIAPSLLWQRFGSGSSPSSASAAQQLQNPQFISDAHSQSRAVELLIRHAFDIFGVDRHEDWLKFFADYPEVAQPSEELLDNAELKAGLIANQSQLPPTAGLDPDDELADEEDEEEEELLEEEMELLATGGHPQMEPKKLRTQSLGIGPPGGGQTGGNAADSGVGSSTASVAQHAPVVTTKTVPIGRRAMESSSSDLDCGSSAASTFRRLQQQQQQLQQYRPAFPSECPPPGPSSAMRKPPGTAPSTRRLNAKQRSFTTSILVSPLADRRNVPAKQSENSPPKMITQKSLDETTLALISSSAMAVRDQRAATTSKVKLTSADGNETVLPSTLRSGEVTVQLGQDCLPDQRQHCLLKRQQLMSRGDSEDVSYV